MGAAASPKVERYLTLDAYRGAVMFLLISHGFGFGELLDHPTLGSLARQFQHVPWEGGVFWDMVQPAFMFIVGVAMPFAFAIRAARGESFRDQARHAAVRALKLILISQIIMSVSKGRLHFQLINVLCQIAFAYFLTFWILQLKRRWQIVTAAGLLVFHTALFYLFPGPDGPFSKVGNIGQVIDKALLGYNYPGYYVTINFITSTVTTLIGAWIGQLLLARKPAKETIQWLAGGAVACFLAALALSPVVPNVKRIWTATFTFYSAGWVLLMMLAFYLAIDVAGFRRWTFPFVVVGANSIFIYSTNIMLRPWLNDAVAVFTGGFRFVGDLAPLFQACSVLLVLWVFCYWLYRRRIFIKV